MFTPLFLPLFLTAKMIQFTQQFPILVLQFFIILLSLLTIHFYPLQNIDLYFAIPDFLLEFFDQVSAVTRLRLVEFLEDAVFVHGLDVQFREIGLFGFCSLAGINELREIVFEEGTMASKGLLTLLGQSLWADFPNLLVFIAENAFEPFSFLDRFLLQLLIELQVQSHDSIQFSLHCFLLQFESSDIRLIHLMLFVIILLQLPQLSSQPLIRNLNAVQLLIQVYVSICHFADIGLPLHQELLDHLNILYFTFQDAVFSVEAIYLVSETGYQLEVILHVALVFSLGVGPELLHQAEH